jgi:glyoxylase I family protein
MTIDPRLGDDLRAWELALARRDDSGIDGGLEALVDEAFTEVGVSGRTYDRAAILPLLHARSHAEISIDDFSAVPLSTDVVLVRYRMTAIDRGSASVEALRSSVWVRRAGRWRIRFHQGTARPPGRGSDPPQPA